MSDEPNISPNDQFTEEEYRTIAKFFRIRGQLRTVPRGDPSRYNPRGTYYSEKNAAEIRDIVDELIVDKQDRLFRYDSFPDYRRNTLYLKIRQSLLYLFDTDKEKYDGVRGHIKTKRGQLGIVMGWDGATNVINVFL